MNLCGSERMIEGVKLFRTHILLRITGGEFLDNSKGTGRDAPRRRRVHGAAATAMWLCGGILIAGWRAGYAQELGAAAGDDPQLLVVQQVEPCRQAAALPMCEDIQKVRRKVAMGCQSLIDI